MGFPFLSVLVLAIVEHRSLVLGVSCHDYCYDVIGCSMEQNICVGRFCTFYEHRLLGNNQRVNIKRSCTNDSSLIFGPQGTEFALRNRCSRSVIGDSEYMVKLCDSNNYCNYICDTNERNQSAQRVPMLFFGFLIFFRIFFLLGLFE